MRFLLVACLLVLFSNVARAESLPPNLLVITVDDMSADSLGAFGCKLPDTSPHIDRLASQGMTFHRAHVQVGNCMPSRNVMFSGLYPHHNRVEGFYQVRNPGYPVLVDLLNEAGYFTAIRGKVPHSTPFQPYAWSKVLDRDAAGATLPIKDAMSYGLSTRMGITAAKEAAKPFALVINVSDPHKPFYAEGNLGQTIPDPHVPTRVFTPEEVPVPGFLPDDPIVRKELSHYYSSVRRADDCVGEVLAALDASGQRERTVIVFLSDHGMPLPFAKTQLYHHSTHTPLIIHWPGITRPGQSDTAHMISAVDLLPTVLEMLHVNAPAVQDGRSFASLMKGEAQAGREFVIKEYNENAGGIRNPMRAVQDQRYLYIFNPWSNGQRKMATATAGTSTYRRMRQLARDREDVAARLKLFDHRVVEELYDISRDPDALHNLVADPDSQAALQVSRERMETWMRTTDDPLLQVFQQRDNLAARESFMQQVETDAASRKQAPKPKPKKANARRLKD